MVAKKGGKRRGNTDYIVNTSARKATFKKRRKGLLKKLSEITTLCGVRACAVIYNPASTEGVPDIFPPNDPSAVANMITEFNNLPEEDQTRKMFNQEDFLTERIKKATEQLRRLKVDNQDKRLSNILDEYAADNTKSFADLPIWDLHDLARLNETNYRQLNHQINNFLMMTDSASPIMPDVPKGMLNINPITFPFHQNMGGGGEGMVNPGFMNQGNGLAPVSANETGFPAWFPEQMRNPQNGGAGTSNLLNIGSSSGSPSVGGGEGMVNPGFMSQGNGLAPMSANETGFPAWFPEEMRNPQNGGAGTSNFLNIGSSSGSPSM